LFDCCIGSRSVTVPSRIVTDWLPAGCVATHVWFLGLHVPLFVCVWFLVAPRVRYHVCRLYVAGLFLPLPHALVCRYLRCTLLDYTLHCLGWIAYLRVLRHTAHTAGLRTRAHHPRDTVAGFTRLRSGLRITAGLVCLYYGSALPLRLRFTHCTRRATYTAARSLRLRFTAPFGWFGLPVAVSRTFGSLTARLRYAVTPRRVLARCRFAARLLDFGLVYLVYRIVRAYTVHTPVTATPVPLHRTVAFTCGYTRHALPGYATPRTFYTAVGYLPRYAVCLVTVQLCCLVQFSCAPYALLIWLHTLPCYRSAPYVRCLLWFDCSGFTVLHMPGYVGCYRFTFGCGYGYAVLGYLPVGSCTRLPLRYGCHATASRTRTAFPRSYSSHAVGLRFAATAFCLPVVTPDWLRLPFALVTPLRIHAHCRTTTRSRLVLPRMVYATPLPATCLPFMPDYLPFTCGHTLPRTVTSARLVAHCLRSATPRFTVALHTCTGSVLRFVITCRSWMDSVWLRVTFGSRLV